MKKVLLSSIIILFIYLPLRAQFVPKRWTKVYQDSLKTVFIDTTSVRKRDKQYIYWSLAILKEPVSIPRIPDKVYKTKTQYVVNDLTKKYNIIGELYYDKIGRLIGENFNRGLTGAGEAFSNNLSDAPFVELLQKKVKDYLNGSFKPDSSQYVDRGTSDYLKKLKAKSKDSLTQTPEDTVTTLVRTEIPPKEEKNPDTNEISNPHNEKIKILSDLKKPGKDHSRSNKNKSKSVIETLKLKRKSDSTKQEQEQKKEIKPKEKYEYNTSKERNATKTIFTDGRKYVVQVSSWKNKRIAEKQKKLLKQMGYNSFITQVYIKKKRGTWNRVRVGYFDSLSEAKKIEREIRRKIK